MTKAAQHRKGPRAWSLVSRLTGGVALIALLSFATQGVVLALWLKPAADDIASIAMEQAVTVQAALQSVPAAQRPALASRLASDTVTLSDKAPALAPRPAGAASRPAPFGFAGGPGEHEVHSRDDIELRTETRTDGRPVLVFRLPVDDQLWWMTRPTGGATGVAGADSAVPGTLLVWLLLLAGVTVGALLLSVRLIARPIGQLAQQIARQTAQPSWPGAQRGGLQPLPERSDDSAELQALVQAFNQLAHQVTTTAQERQQLLAGVSHDLRTPLARLRLRAETQCEPPLADALGADLQALERIADQFLAYVHSDGSIALGTPAPLEHSVRDAVLPYLHDTPDGPVPDGAAPAVQLLLEPVGLQVPDLAVQRLLSNLIDNALAYGRAPVQVLLRATAAGAELLVSDHGPGMTDDEFHRAQQPFVRLTRARSELGHCGLGLAIVAQIARQLGGSLRPLRAPTDMPAGWAPGFAIVLTLPRSDAG